MAELVFFRRGEEVMRVTLSEGRMVLGRGDVCDIALPDPEISRAHAALTLQGETCLLEDLSGKGCVVGGDRVKSTTLTDGSDISFGKWQAIFRPRGGKSRLDITDTGAKTEVVRADAQALASVPVQISVKNSKKRYVVKNTKWSTFSIGTDDTNDLVLDERFVSGRHLKITRQGERFQLADHHSTNGTWLGDTRIYEATVPFFTDVRVGEVTISIEPATPTANKAAAGKAPVFHGIIGADPTVVALAETIERVGKSMATVTILGESGTGKELVAQALHTVSPRASGPFIPVNCAAISKELIESELFGHEKGSFTGAQAMSRGAFEEANGGTIFLDEIGELPLGLQAKLLRVLESGEIKRVGAARPMKVDVRVVAATNKDLLRRSRDGSFREDLYYRICIVPLTLTPLRQRMGDLVALAEHFVNKFAPSGRAIELTASAVQRLKNHDWPGNIRELRNVIHRALLLRKGKNIDEGDINYDAPAGIERDGAPVAFRPHARLKVLLDEAREYFVAEGATYYGGITQASTAMGFSRSADKAKTRKAAIDMESQPDDE